MGVQIRTSGQYPSPEGERSPELRSGPPATYGAGAQGGAYREDVASTARSACLRWVETALGSVWAGSSGQGAGARPPGQRGGSAVIQVLSLVLQGERQLFTSHTSVCVLRRGYEC